MPTSKEQISGGPEEQPVVSPFPAAAGLGPLAMPRSSVWLIRIIKIAILAVAFIAPLFYLPFTPDILLAKVVLVEVAAVLVLAAWLLSVLITKRLSYKRTPLNAAFLALAVMLLAATVFSRAPWASFWGSDPTGEKTATLLSFIALSFVVASTFRRKDAERAGAVVLASFLFLGVFALVSITSGRMGISLPGWLAINPAGTVNALALVLAAGFVFSLGLALTRMTSLGRIVLGRRLGLAAMVTAAILFAALALIGFSMMWIGIGAVMLLFTAFSFARSWEREGRKEHAWGGAAVAVAFLVLALSLFLSFKSLPLAARIFQPPLEISPSFKATLTIGAKALKTNPALGLGPANFRLAFNQFRDPALNSTIFWQTRFAHGFSFLTTLLATIGILGLAAFLGFAAIAGVLIPRALWRAEESDPWLWALAGASLFILLEWFIYASNFTLSFLLFLFLGLLAALAQEGGVMTEASPVRDKPRRDVGADVPPLAERISNGASSWWRITRRLIIVDSPALNFAVSLIVVFAAAFSLVALYGLGTQYAAEIYFARASRVLNLYGNIDTAKVFLNRAVVLNPKNDGYYQGQSQVALIELNRIIAQAAASPQEDLSSRFRNEFSGGINAANAAAALSPQDPQTWFLLGQLYELVIPFVAGADRAAQDAYERAHRFDPSNPVIKLAKARVLITAADVTSLQAGQTQGQERERLDAVYKEAIQKAHQELDATIGLKPDFAPAHFLLVQTYIREGNLGQAIHKGEETAALVPQDIGVAFQLGFLYYRNDELNKAEGEFKRAVALNENYSNARYFLGLIYDRRGERTAALNQFQKIADLNPGNEEVARIVSNLRAGRRALEGISPPAPSPETRKEAPVKEEREAQPLRKR